MHRLDILGEKESVTPQIRKTFIQLFEKSLSAQQVQAIRDLFPGHGGLASVVLDVVDLSVV